VVTTKSRSATKVHEEERVFFVLFVDLRGFVVSFSV